MQKTPVITIVHELPGRLRMRTSQALNHPERLENAVKGHSGIDSVKYTPITRSILVQFDPQEVRREEIVIRVGLALALGYGCVPVQFFSEPKMHEMTDSTFYSGFLLAIAMLNRVISRSYNTKTDVTIPLFEWSAGLSTAWAVLDHGALEVKERGNFDPEVLSLVYLLIALFRKNFLPAAIFTWITTFGRHLIHMPSTGVELRPLEVPDENAEHPSYEVVITQVQSASEKRMLLNLLPAAIKYAATGKPEWGQGNLIDEIKKVSALHGEVLEGLGGYRFGIPLKIR